MLKKNGPIKNIKKRDTEQLKKKYLKKVRKKQVLYYFLKQLASKNYSVKTFYTPKSANSKYSNKLIYAKDLNYVKNKKEKKNKKI